MSSEEKETEDLEKIGRLTLAELSENKQILDKDLEFIQESINTLKAAQKKFAESKTSVEKMSKYSKTNENGTMLIPLTGSMYTNGIISEPDKFTVNIGAGYYIKMNTQKTINYFNRRVQYVGEQIDVIQKIHHKKLMLKEYIVCAIQDKITVQLGNKAAPAVPTELDG